MLSQISRRQLLTVAGLGPVVWMLSEENLRPAEAAKNVLVVGMDISDTNFLDPARQFVYSAPMTIHATYEAPLTLAPGDYETLRPLLATSWERVDGGAAWLLHLRQGVKFASGNPLTAADVKFSYERVQNLKDSPADLATNLGSIAAVDDYTVKITMVDKNQPLITLLTSPTFVVTDSRTIMAHGGVSGAGADKTDKASGWLDQNSAGTGPYILKQWERNQQIVLERNASYWRRRAAFERVIIRHIPESETQLLTLKRGDIDAALNLTPKQVDSLSGTPGVQVVQGRSLDFVYMTLTSSADLNASLAKKEARQAVAHAIDYDGLIKALLEGYAVRPPNFIPVGMASVTPQLTKQIGYQYNPQRAKALLQQAGLPNGLSFEISYGSAAVAGTTYPLIAAKIQSDLAKVGITAKLNPMDQATMRTKFLKGETQSVLTFWNPDFADPWDWAEPAVHRVAKRVHWNVPQQALDLMTKGAGATTKKESDAYYLQLQKTLVDEANYLVLFQPVYRYAVRTSITGWKPTAAGWLSDLYDVRPT
jgi:peptide/nickel transport system substrate-binding protein